MPFTSCLKRVGCVQSFTLLYLLLSNSTTVAQIVPDTTLPSNSVVESGGSGTKIINGGTAEGINLFHSFEQFNVTTGSTAYFNNATNIQNIFSRITGNSISNIDGILRANGSANLFLLNRNGIIFGPNASLNIGGSFLATSASQINFADRTVFSTQPSQATPVLTVSVPVGLNLDSSSGKIYVQGLGHNLIGQNFRPVTGTNQSIGLRVQPGKSISLVGGDVILEGGVLTAPGGRIEVGSVNSGTLNLISNGSNLKLDYAQASNFKDIRLYTRALIDASGSGSGFVQLQGKNINLRDGSVIIIQNQGLQNSEAIALNASDSVEVNGTDPIAKIPGSIRTETLTLGKGGDILVSAPKLAITEGGSINTVTYGRGAAGNITLDSPTSVEVIGSSPRSSITLSSISSATFSNGKAGDISVQTGNYIAKNGGTLLSATSSNGAGGNIRIDAAKSIELLGYQPNTLAASAIGASTSNSGNAGGVILNTSKLLLENGGRVDSSTLVSGNAGSITINALDSVEVKGTIPNSRNPSLIISSGNVLDEVLLASYGLPKTVNLTGSSGNIKITTNKLTVRDGGSISVSNDGAGNAGALEVFAKSIFLDNKARMTAATASGQGGIISVKTDRLQLTNSSNITATAIGGNRSGGNIAVNADTLVALKDSNITANAFKGRGGNIQITTQGLFRSPDSDISASSNLGVDGNVNIQTFGLDVRNSITPLQNRFTTTEQAIAGSCLARRNVERGSFIVTGSGGLPINPYSGIERWDNLTGVELTEKDDAQSQQSLLPSSNYDTSKGSPRKWKLGDPIIEAQTLIVSADGRASLVASSSPTEISNADSLVCKGDRAKT